MSQYLLCIDYKKKNSSGISENFLSKIKELVLLYQSVCTFINIGVISLWSLDGVYQT